MLKPIRIFLILIITTLHAGYAQEWEMGGWIGASGYVGDLNPDNPAKFTDPAIGLNVRYGYSPYSALKFSMAYGTIRADDADSKHGHHRARNLSFKTPVTELALLYEFYFFNYSPGSGRYKFTPYVFTGIAAFIFEPTAEYQGSTVKLRVLGTEGQGTVLGAKSTYSNIALAIPFGLGIKYNFADNFNIGLELGYRNTFTDYLDDVSKTYVDRTVLATTNGQLASDLSDRSAEVMNGIYMGETNTMRGDPSRRDFYMFTGITFSYTITPIKCPDFKEMR